MESLGFTERLNLSNNDITTINSLKKLGYIEYLDLSNNNVSDLEVLLDLPFLRSVNLENNNIIDDKQTIIALVNREVAIQHNRINQYTEYESEEIPNDIIYIENPNMFEGREVISQQGYVGFHEFRIDAITLNGKEIKRDIVKVHHHEPVNKIIQVGTKEITSEDLVYFEDKVLSTIINKKLGLNPTDKIIRSDLDSLLRLDLSNVHDIMRDPYLPAPVKVSSLIGLEQAKNLSYLKMDYHNISDITPLSNLQSLDYIDLSNNQISDISGLSNLQALRELDLRNNEIVNIGALSDLPSLEYLDVGNNQISMIDGLNNLPVLHSLDLSGNKIEDVSNLSNLLSLQYLSLSENNISDISALEKLPLLQFVSLDGNTISDISILTRLDIGRELNLSNNKISDITLLKNFESIEYLDLSNNNLKDITALENLKFIESLDLSSNNLSDIKVLLNLPLLRSVNLENNYLIDADTIKNLVNKDVIVFRQDIDHGYDLAQTEIPFETIYVEDFNLPVGIEVIYQEGENGLKETKLEIVTLDGEEIKRKFFRERIDKNPVAQVIHIGTKPLDDQDAPEQENEELKFIDISVSKEDYVQGESIYLTVKVAAESSQDYIIDYVELYFDPEIIAGNPHQSKEGVYFDWSIFTRDEEGNHIASMPIRIFEESGNYKLVSGVVYDTFGNSTSIDAKDFPIEFTVNENSSNTWPESYEDLYNSTGITAYADNMYRSDLQMMASNVTNDFPKMPREELGSNYALYDIHFVDGLFYEKTNVNIPITVTIPYSSTLNPENLYYFGENFEIVKQVDFTDNSGSITFETDTFKYFGIQFADPKSDEEKEDTTTKNETRTEKVPFKTERVNNPDLLVGTEEVSQEGVDGVRTIVERVTLVNGKETKREVISNKITLDPVNQIIQVGTKAKEDDKNDGSKKDENDKEKLVTAKIERHEGADREAVAIDVAEKHFSEAKKVIIVNQDKFPDAISATNISQGNFPVLYTRADKLGQATIDFMSSMKSLDEIYLLGGKTSISEAIEKLLIDQFGGIITRIDGATRFDANANAIRENYAKADHIVIATGESYTDALYGVSYANTLDAPIILSKTDRLVEASLALMKDLGVTQATIIGGVNSVTPDLEAQLKELGIKINPRIAGQTRYDGSVQVASESYAQPDTLLIASGDTFTDALVSAPLAQKLNAPILLVRKDSMVEEVNKYLENHAGSIKNIYIQGGPHTISKANEAAIVKAVKPADKPKKAASKSKAHLSKTKEGNISTSEQVLSGLAYRGEEAKSQGVFNRNYSI